MDRTLRGNKEVLRVELVESFEEEVETTSQGRLNYGGSRCPSWND